MAFAVPVYQSLFELFSYGGRIETPPTFLSKSHGIPIPICVFSLNGWYWVNTPTVSTPEFIQLLSGKSIIRYLPPNATAGFATLYHVSFQLWTYFTIFFTPLILFLLFLPKSFTSNPPFRLLFVYFFLFSLYLQYIIVYFFYFYSLLYAFCLIRRLR